MPRLSPINVDSIIGHQEMASIPCLILVREEGLKELVEIELKKIEKKDDEESRAWLIEAIPNSK